MIFMLALIYLVNIKMPTYTKMTQMPITISGSFISNKVLNNIVYKIMVNFGYTDTNKSGYKQIQIDMVMNRVGVFESSQPSSQFFRASFLLNRAPSLLLFKVFLKILKQKLLIKNKNACERVSYICIFSYIQGAP